MAQPAALVLEVPEAAGDADLELSPCEESDVHDSFHRLIQEQSLRVAEEGLELLPRGAAGRGRQTLPRPAGAPVHSSATLRVLASMPSRTIGRSRGAIISQYYNRTVRLRRRRNSRPLLGNVVRSARPSLRLYDLELDHTVMEEDGDMSHSFGESYRVGSTKGIHALTVFCSWDYKVTQKRASRVQQDSICTQLKELLAEWQLRERPQSACGQLWQAAMLGLGWLLCLGTTMGCAAAVLTFSEVMIQRPDADGQGVELLALPLVVSVLNLGASYLFRGLATLERHDSPVLEVYMAICRCVAAGVGCWEGLLECLLSGIPLSLHNLCLHRSLILKMAVLGVLCYHWLGRRVAKLQAPCWEDFVGQELYRFLVVDFIFTLLDSLFGELVWR
ncbi:transmembrane channel-like gene family 6 [Cricetulus griseus]